MVKLLLVLLSVFTLSLVGLYYGGQRYPYYLYQSFLSGEPHQLYHLNAYQPQWMAPTFTPVFEGYAEDYPQLWKTFPLGPIMLPLPVRHPFYQLQPIVEFQGKNKIPTIGIEFKNPEKKMVLQLVPLPSINFKDHTNEQPLFKLPIARNHLLSLKKDEIWRDLFEMKIEVRDKDLKSMIYDLYLYYLRSKYLPKEMVQYGWLGDKNIGIIELNSPNKDYRVEIIQTYANGSIFRYLMNTYRLSEEATKLRSKYLQELVAQSPDSSMQRLIYSEFKNMTFDRQIDQEGMLYLYSAWSQTPLGPEYFKEMIQYLERTEKYKEQLKPLYKYAIKQFGRSFSNLLSTWDYDPELVLLRKIEIEEREKEKKMQQMSATPVKIEITPKEQMNENLRKVKDEMGPLEKEGEMKIH